MKKFYKYIILVFILIICAGFLAYKIFSKNTVAVIGAMNVEIQEILNNLSDSKNVNHNGFEINTGKIGKVNIVLTKSGVGKVNSSITTQYIIDKYNPKYIINTGIAGSLTDKLKAGDIIIAEKMIQHDFDLTAFGQAKGYMGTKVEPNNPTIYYSDPKLVKKFSKNLSDKGNIYTGTIITGDTFVTDSVQKEKLSKEFKADGIDMESAAIAQTAEKNNVPLIVLKTISDSKTDSTDDYKQNRLNTAVQSAKNIILMLEN